MFIRIFLLTLFTLFTICIFGNDGATDTYIQEPGTFMRAAKNNKIGEITLTNDGFIVEFDFDIIHGHGDEFMSILHIGDTNEVRLPGIWFYPGKFQLHVTLSDKNSWNNIYDNGSPQLTCCETQRYKFKLSVIPQSWDNLYSISCSLNGQVYGVTYHNIDVDIEKGNNVPIYLGDPWYNPAGVRISNLNIKPAV